MKRLVCQNLQYTSLLKWGSSRSHYSLALEVSGGLRVKSRNGYAPESQSLKKNFQLKETKLQKTKPAANGLSNKKFFKDQIMNDDIKLDNQNPEIGKDEWQSLIFRLLPNDELLTCIPLSDIKKKEQEWIWKNRIPKGTLTIVEGDGGRGKSTIIADICSRLSTGIRLPDDDTERPPMKILLLVAEDDPNSVLRPRFETHEANLFNIHIETQAMTLNTKGILAITEAVITRKYDLIVIDPIVSFLGQRIDMNKSNDVRSIMGPLISLSRETGCTIIVVRHFNKSRDGLASQRGAGSVDFRNAARSVLQIVQCEGKTYLALEKSNYATRAKTLPFSISPENGRVCWGQPCDLSADDLHFESQGGMDRSALDEACEFLKIELKEPKPVKDIFKSSRENGISDKTLQRASKKLNVKKIKTSSCWEWSLQSQAGQVSQL